MGDKATNSCDWHSLSVGFQTITQSCDNITNEYFYLDGMTAPQASVEGTVRKFVATGHRILDDPLDKKLFAPPINGEAKLRLYPYRYFNIINGEGEEGMVSVQIAQALPGAPFERSAFECILVTQGRSMPYLHPLAP